MEIDNKQFIKLINEEKHFTKGKIFRIFNECLTGEWRMKCLKCKQTMLEAMEGVEAKTPVHLCMKCRIVKEKKCLKQWD